MSIIITRNGQPVLETFRAPARKNVGLYHVRGANYDPIAYFRTDEDAETFEQIMLDIIPKNQEETATK